MQPTEIKHIIESHLFDANAIVEGDGAHFTAIVVSPEFTGKSRLQKQQLVYAALRKQISDGTLHAISIKTYTPEEWQKQQNI